MDFKWTDRVAGVDPASANDINTVAHAVEALNEEIKSLPSGGGGGGGGTSGNVPTKLSELEADSITRTDLNPFSFTAYIADFGGHEMNFGFDNITFKKTDYGFGIDFDGQTLNNVGTPEADTDGANKKYVDDAVKNVDIPEVPITTTSDSVTLNGKDFLYIESADSMGFRTRNNMYFESENDMSLWATNINVAGDMTVQDPVNDASVANKKYVDDLVGDVETALDNIIALQNAKIEG